MKKLSFLFALLCASVMGFAAAPVTGSSTENMDGQPGFTNGYDYSFSTEGTSVTISFTEKEGYVGLVAYLWNYTNGFAETQMSVSGSTASITLTNQVAGSTLTFACKFAFAGGMSVTKQFTYVVPDGGSGGKTASELSLNATAKTLDAVVPETFQIVATTAEGYDGTITYASSNTGIASVTDAGLVTAVSRGTATITVTAPETDNFAASTKELTVTVTGMPKKASGQGYGSMQLKDVDLYDWDNQFAGSVACGKADLYVVTWGNTLIYKAVIKDGKTFENCTNYFCQLRTWKPDSTTMQEQWALTCSDDHTTRYLQQGQATNNSGLVSYGDEVMLTSYMVVSGCGARTMEAVIYTRDYINNYNASDVTAPVLGAATVTPGEESITITFDEITSEEVFYLIEDEEHSKKYISQQPKFVLAKDGSGITYNYSCYAIDYSGNKSATQTAEVEMPFSAITNQALNKQAYSGQEAKDCQAYRAVDGNINTRWSPGGVAAAEDAWWAIDLNEIYNISSIEMVWEGAYSNDFIIYGADEKPLAWNDSTKYDVALVTNKVVPATGTDKNNIYSVSGHARYLLFIPKKLANKDWGASFYEFRVFATSVYDPDAGEDTDKPVINSATATSITHNSAVIELDATDNVGIIKVNIVDEAKGINVDLVPSDQNTLTVTGLLEQTTYTLTLTAFDAAGLKSDGYTLEAFKTGIDPTMPQVAAPVPSGTNKEVRPIYSDAFTSILAHSFDKDGFAGVKLLMEKEIEGDNFLVYNVAGENEITWGMYDDGAAAIIAVDGYHSETGKGVDASTMEYMHLDIWSLQSANNAINIFINDAALKSLRLSHGGEGWQSYNIALSEFAEGEAGKKSDNIRWMKFTGIGFISGKIALDNLYFYKDKGDATSIDNTVEAVKAVKVIENGQLIIIKNGIRYNVAGQMVK